MADMGYVSPEEDDDDDQDEDHDNHESTKNRAKINQHGSESDERSM